MTASERKRRNIRAAICLIIFFVIVGCLAVDAKILTVTEYSVSCASLPSNFDGFRILHLSDLHDAGFGEGGQRIREIVYRENPDMIVMTGDMVDERHKSHDDFYSLAKTLAENYRVYYVFGNHEQRLSAEEQQAIRDEFYGTGVHLLENSSDEIRLRDQSITVTGLVYDYSHYRGENGSRLSATEFTIDEMNGLLGKKEDSFHILLAHNPLDFPVYAEWGAELTLSGHIHGGMIRLPLIGGLLSPELKFFPEYDCGLYYEGGSVMEVSRGLGKVRVFNRPEIVIVTLHSTD